MKQNKLILKPFKPIEPAKDKPLRTNIHTFSSYNKSWDNEDDDYCVEDIKFPVSDILDLLKGHNLNNVYFELEPCHDYRGGPIWANLMLFKQEEIINENYEVEMKSFERKMKKYEKNLAVYKEQQLELEQEKKQKEIKSLEIKLKALKKK